MFNKKQIQTIIKVLKFKGIEGRIAFQQIFEQGGYLWATNGYIVLELGEAGEELKDKCITLQALVGWSETHKAKDTTSLIELAEVNEFQEPNMVKLLHQEYIEPRRFDFHIDLLELATVYLGVKNFTVRQGTSNEHIFLVKPLEDMFVINEAMEIKAYVMKPKNKRLMNKNTGEVITFKDLLTDEFIIDLFSKDSNYLNSKLNQIIENWEICDEDELFYVISAEHKSGYDCVLKEEWPEICKVAKELGIGFESEKGCRKSIEKLKAWTRLKDKRFRFDGYDVAGRGDGTICGQVYFKAGIYDREEIQDDLYLLFGGEQ